MIRAIPKRLLIAISGIAATLLLALPALGGGRPLTADLSAENEVPPAESNASGVAHLTLNQGQGEICVDIESSGYVNGDDDVLAGHIHDAPAGQNSGIVVNLQVDSANHSICVDGLEKDLIKDIRKNPANYYINIHTSFAPGGEIRGQLSK